MEATGELLMAFPVARWASKVLLGGMQGLRDCAPDVLRVAMHVSFGWEDSAAPLLCHVAG